MSVEVDRNSAHPFSQKLTQTLTLVMRSSVHLVRPLIHSQNWSLSSLFGVEMGESCTLADVSNAYVEIPRSLADLVESQDNSGLREQEDKYWSARDSSPFRVSPQPSRIEGSHGHEKGFLLLYDLKYDDGLDFMFEWQGENSSARWTQSPAKVTAQTFLRNSKGDAGGLVLLVRWPGGTVQQERACILQHVPWFVRVWTHTMQIEFDAQVTQACT